MFKSYHEQIALIGLVPRYTTHSGWSGKEIPSIQPDSEHFEMQTPPNQELNTSDDQDSDVHSALSDPNDHSANNNINPYSIGSTSFYEQIRNLNSLLHDGIEPGIQTGFQNVLHGLLKEVERQALEIKRLSQTIKREKDMANTKLIQFEEDNERENARREHCIRKEERTRYDKSLADLESKYQKAIQANDYMGAEIRRSNWVEGKTNSSSKSKSLSSHDDDFEEGLCSTTFFKAIEKLEQLKTTLLENLDEIRDAKEMINRSLLDQNEVLRDQLTLLTCSNSKLLDENDLLKSQIVLCGSNGSRLYSTVSDHSIPNNVHTRGSEPQCHVNMDDTNLIKMAEKNSVFFGIESFSLPPSPTGKEGTSPSDDIYTSLPKANSYKIIFLGDSSVGKTSLIKTICGDDFSQFSKATLGVDFFAKQMVFDGQQITIHLWDTAGQERFRCLSRSYYRRADGVVLVYDVTNDKSFKSTRFWIEEIQGALEIIVPVVLVANKLDLRIKSDVDMVSRLAGAKLSHDLKVSFIETSARTGLNVNDILIELVSQLQRLRKVPRQFKGQDIKRDVKPRQRCC